MEAINSIGSMESISSTSCAEDIHLLDEILSGKMSEPSFGFTLMYEEWKQKILLSDGVNDDQNIEW